MKKEGEEQEYNNKTVHADVKQEKKLREGKESSIKFVL